MNSKIIIFLVVALSINFTFAGKCPSNPPAKHNLDVNKYLGAWHLLVNGKAWHGEQNNLDCIMETYGRRTDNNLLLDVEWAGRFDGTWRTDKGIIANVEPSRWDFYMDQSVFHSTIVSTDYTTWAIEYACIKLAGVMKENYMIRSRTHELAPDVLNTLKSIVEGFGMSPEDFVTIRQANCI